MALYAAPSGPRSGPTAQAGARRQPAASTNLFHWATAGLLGALGLVALMPDALAQNQAPNQPPGSGQAQPRLEPTGESFGDWQLICTVAGATTGAAQPEACFITQQFLEPNSQRPILKITIGNFGAQQRKGAVVAMPLGIPLSRGVQISVDGRPVSTVPFQFCRRDGCQAFVQMDEAVVSSFQAGSQAIATVRSGENEAINMPFSLKGFTAGYAKIK
ncbi:invasion associated locus B family protein [Pelagibius litoralis]|uniref:Invasion associated locus B family protein n=1 Tax=Pelagibius litoralis TaxID=374515 RepID=A0A967F0J6_9PROT|nr:invasion associated locus B family protein [Pelagibius litoralis]NIA70886.1 invasion associated locus B family protein [Pelagibius litoralis]